MKPYYEEDGVTLYCGDCLELLPGLPPVDLVLTDPPYEAEAHTQQRRVKRGGGVLELEPLGFAPMVPSHRDTVSQLIATLSRRWVLTFCQIEAVPLWRCSYEAAGLVYRRTCIWVKPDGMPQYSGDRPGMGYETFVAMHRPGKSHWNGGGRHGVFTVHKHDGIGANGHPTQKPLRLIAELVRLFSDAGELVLDPYAGSGTTLVAAKRLRCKAIGIELNEEYCELAARRLSQQIFDFEPQPQDDDLQAI